MNDYEASKQTAERLVLGAGLPASVIRPSLLIGHSLTGAMQEFQGFHLLMGLFMKSRLPLLSADPKGRIDVIPRDVAARAIAGLLRRGGPPGEYWLTAGDAAPTIEDLIGIGRDFSERVLSRDLPRPRLVSEEMFDRLIKPVFYPALPPAMRKTFDRVQFLGKYLAMGAPLPSDLDRLSRLTGEDLSWDMGAVVRANLHHMHRAGEFGAFVPSPVCA